MLERYLMALLSPLLRDGWYFQSLRNGIAVCLNREGYVRRQSKAKLGDTVPQHCSVLLADNIFERCKSNGRI